MGKRKAEDELSRFVWKRKSEYDMNLLDQVQGYNPFAFNNQKRSWVEVAETLREDFHMKVTDRSCRERVSELLKSHRQNELSSIRA